jgi:copper chaperone CopZ
MRRTPTMILAAALVTVVAAAGSQDSKIATLYSDRIACEACAAVITKALRGVPGVGKVQVDVEKQEVLVQFNPAKAGVADLTAATAKRGFPSSVRKVEP